jgi:recombination protein RecR
MAKFAQPMERLIEELRKLPGIGSRGAQRLAFHLLRADESDADALSAAIRELKAQLRLCSRCNNITDVDPCVYCTSATRNQRQICVVEEPTNIASIEKTHYNGVYHVLHGTLSPLHGVGPEHLRLKNLLERAANGNADEIILALNPTVEGEATAMYIAAELKSAGVKITRIATGVPAGGDIEYVDEVTMQRSLEGRREV